jgi:hypothetical protein
MKTNAPRTWLAALLVGLIAACFITVTGWLLASPSEEITKAVSASGKANVKQTNSDAFLDAFASVLVTVKKKDAAPYVAAATKMRPDLKDQISETSGEVYDAAKDTDAVDQQRVSRHRRKVPICCHCPNPNSCHTLYFPPREARKFLEMHPQCMQGVCPPT